MDELMVSVPVHLGTASEPASHVEVAASASVADVDGTTAATAIHAQLRDVEDAVDVADDDHDHHGLTETKESDHVAIVAPDDTTHDHGPHAADAATESDDDGAMDVDGCVDVAPADVAVDARRHSGSNASATGTGGRLRVNDKGEPLPVMLPSFIWDYFVKEDNGKFVVCTLCPTNATRFAYSGGTSTMNRHLRKKHHKYAPGKTPADYEYPKAAKRALAAALASGSHSLAATTAVSTSGGLVLTNVPSPASSVSAGIHSGAVHTADLTATNLLPIGPLSPTEVARRQLIDLRNARRRATTNKRRKLLHGMLDADQYAAATSSTPAPPPPPPRPQPQPQLPAEFDPSAFVTLHTPGVVGGLQFPPGFDLTDAGTLDASATTADVRLLDYTPSTLLHHTFTPPLFVPRPSLSTRRTPQQQKLLTHRLLKYLIAQYEPLDVSRMGAELSALVSGADLFVGSGPSSHSGVVPTGGVVHHGGVDTLTSPKLLLLPSEETLKLALANLYYSQREMLKEVIAEVDVLSLSLNNWKSVFGQNVLTVRGHWISQGFRRRDCVLEVYVLPLDESVNTIALLRDVMDKWDIAPTKVAALTMLPSKRDDKAIHEEYPGLTIVTCFVSVLDHAVSAGLLKCAPLIRRCRNYVSYFIQNPSEYQIFLSLQRKVAEAAHVGGVHPSADEATHAGTSTDAPKHSAGGTDGTASTRGPHRGAPSSGSGSTPSTPSTPSPPSPPSPLPLPALSVICDFEDRWNSTSEMICRIVELEHMLLLYKSNLESDTSPNRRPMQLRFVCCELSADEWTSLKELARLLEPIEGVVHVATHGEYPTLSITLPLLHSIHKHLDHAELWVATTLVATVRTAIASALAAAGPLCSCGAMPTLTPYLSCLLDPRFKALPFLDATQREQLLEMLHVLHMETVDADGHTASTLADKDAVNVVDVDMNKRKAKKGGHLLLHAFFADASTVAAPPAELERLKAHVQLYLDSPALPATDDRENDPLEWWSRSARSFPWLAKLATKFLCLSAVSVPFYEAFTNHGQLMREKKARLDIEVAAQILFCRSVSRIPEMERMNV